MLKGLTRSAVAGYALDMVKQYAPLQETPLQETPLQNSRVAGEYPFTRGIHKNMYRDRLWTMRQYAGFSSARESNKRYKMLLAEGARGLSVAFDLPTQMGYDSDHIMAAGEVGQVGVAICSLDDMQILFDDIDVSKISTSMTINSTSGILLALYIAVARQRGLDTRQLRGTVQNDLLKEYISRGTYIYPPKASMRIVTDVIEYCATELPQWNAISVSGYHMREAGATAVQEVAFTLANGIAYVQATLDRGLNINKLARRLSFFFNGHNNFLEEVAKFRAARTLWANIMKKRFAATDPKAQQLRFHTQTAGVTLTAQQPENNIVRVALQALAAVLGGTQSLHTNAMDEALGLPTSASARTALRTQQIIAHESGVTKVVDPLGGSHYIEQLTQSIYDQAQHYIQRVDELGGAVECVNNGFFQTEIQNSAYEHQQAVDAKKEIIVGVNDFTAGSQEQQAPTGERVSEDVVRDQCQRLAKLRRERDATKVQTSLEHLKTACQQKQNLMPLFIEAVENKATLGEISEACAQVLGRHREQVRL